ASAISSAIDLKNDSTEPVMNCAFSVVLDRKSDMKVSMECKTSFLSSTTRSPTRPALSKRLNLRRVSWRSFADRIPRYPSHVSARSISYRTSTALQDTSQQRGVE